MKDLGLVDLNKMSPSAIAGLRRREASRAVVFDAENRVALLHVTKKMYYKLPGGGIEAGEDQVTALKRECLEEIGCDVHVMGEIGSIREYRGSLNQTSYCFLAKVVGEKGTPLLTEDEIQEGFVTCWVPIDQAIEIVSRAQGHGLSGTFVRVRDATILKEAEILIRAL